MTATVVGKVLSALSNTQYQRALHLSKQKRSGADYSSDYLGFYIATWPGIEICTYRYLVASAQLRPLSSDLAMLARYPTHISLTGRKRSEYAMRC